MTDDRRRAWLPWVLLALLIVGVLLATERHGRGKAVARADSLGVVAQDSAKAARRAFAEASRMSAMVDSMREAYKPVAGNAIKWKTNWDTLWLPGDTTLTLARARQIGDSAIGSCHLAKTRCEEIGDSLQVVVDSTTSAANKWEASAKAQEQSASQWKKIARGPWLALAVEGTVTTGLVPQGAGEVTLGRGHLKILGRVEVGQGAETCAFLPSTEAYSCSTPVEAVARVGARWTF